MKSGVVVATFGSRPAAEVARSALAASGIRATIEADDTAGLGPDLSLSKGVRLLVTKEDADSARRLLT